MSEATTLTRILDLARWAPSGDNVQSWSFEIVDPMQVRVHCKDTRDHCVYDLDGHPSQISFGALLETMAIAASGHGWRADAVRQPDSAPDAPVFDVRFVADASVVPSPLIASIEKRTVQRRAMRTRPLTSAEKQAMAAAVGSDYQIVWMESAAERWQVARLMFNNAKLRLTMPEAYEVHRDIIDWNKTFSTHKVPDQALGVDAMTLRLMHWAMASWQRMAKVNAILGTVAPRLQMDLLPSMACAAHFVIKARRPAETIDDYVAAGRAVQRFWLTLTALGLFMQPEMTPLIFSRYVWQGRRFSRQDQSQALAERLLRQSSQLIDADAVYMGRIGAGPAPHARSHRRPLAELMK